MEKRNRFKISCSRVYLCVLLFLCMYLCACFVLVVHYFHYFIFFTVGCWYVWPSLMLSDLDKRQGIFFTVSGFFPSLFFVEINFESNYLTRAESVCVCAVHACVNTFWHCSRHRREITSPTKCNAQDIYVEFTSIQSSGQHVEYDISLVRCFDSLTVDTAYSIAYSNSHHINEIGNIPLFNRKPYQIFRIQLK